MALKPITRLRRICLALPQVHEVEAWGEPTFRVRNRIFAMFASAGNHHGGGRPSVWCKAAAGEQDVRVRMEPERYFVPPYVGPSGWVGVWLDGDVDWHEVRQMMTDAFRLIAPKRVVAELALTGRSRTRRSASSGR